MDDGQPVRSPWCRVKVAGAELGALLGWMSSKVLGQYDLLVLEDEDPEDQDVVHMSVTNILALEKRHSFPPEQFRMWVALHEVTHRPQFTGVPWLRQHFLDLVAGLLRRPGRPTRMFVTGRIAEGGTRSNPLTTVAPQPCSHPGTTRGDGQPRWPDEFSCAITET
ncbi:MAG: zinc-dependent metalloprotease [Microthrixaceae bacterium]